MQVLIKQYKEKLTVPIALWGTYLIVYFIWGTVMNWFGKAIEVASFTYWWQVITCYCLYMVPISILLRDKPFFEQYIYGVAAIAPIEFLGYLNNTSIAIHIVESGNTVINNGNLLAKWVDIKNFSLAMTIFFGVYFPLGNKMVAAVYRLKTKFE